MTPQLQKYLHDPANGTIGDCHRTALACLLDMDRDAVPHFGELAWDWERGEINDTIFCDSVSAWLHDQGFVEVSIALEYADINDLFTMSGFVCPQGYCILGGTGPRGTNHSVIMCGGRIVHDPAIQGGGIVGPCKPTNVYWLTWLLPVRFTTQAAPQVEQLA